MSSNGCFVYLWLRSITSVTVSKGVNRIGTQLQSTAISDLNLILGKGLGVTNFFFSFVVFVLCFGRLLRRVFGMGSDDSRIRKKNRREREMTSLSLYISSFSFYIFTTHNIPHKRFRLAYFSSGFALYRKGGKIFFPNRRRFGHVIVCKLASSQ
jgi:hypothetical protein